MEPAFEPDAHDWLHAVEGLQIYERRTDRSLSIAKVARTTGLSLSDIAKTVAWHQRREVPSWQGLYLSVVPGDLDVDRSRLFRLLQEEFPGTHPAGIRPAKRYHLPYGQAPGRIGPFPTQYDMELPLRGIIYDERLDTTKPLDFAHPTDSSKGIRVSLEALQEGLYRTFSRKDYPGFIMLQADIAAPRARN